MQFYVPSKSVPSSAGKAASGVASRMSKNAGHASETKSGKGKFGAALMALAKLRSGHLQHGVPKHAPTGGKVPFGSKINPPQGNFGGANTSPDQAALNQEQQ